MKKILSFILAVLMLVSVIPVAISAADTYTVILHAGPEGQGNSFVMTKKAGEALSLAHLRADVTSAYGLEPKGGDSDQRVFIMWAEGYNATTGRGTGNTYFESYDEDRDVELYAIWGYPIMFNADGGRYVDGSTRKLQYVANYANWNGENTDPKSMYRYNMPDWNGDVPTKENARRVNNDRGYAYALVRADGVTAFTWEGYGENLTIPPVGGAMAWSDFHCVAADDPENPYGIAFPEFYAVWEPAVTYDPNGGQGQSYSEYMVWDWKMWVYERYTIDDCSFTNSGAKFTGWNTEPDGSGRAYPAGRRITNTPDKDSDGFTLYAQWEYDHEHSYGSVTTEPTCAEEGETVYTCTVCGHSYSETVPATGEHSYDSVTAEPTCAEEGETVYTCTVCGHSYSETVPATGEHAYGDWAVTDEPTYLEEGREERVCGVCSAVEDRKIPVKEYVNKFTDVKDSHWFYDEVEYCVKHGYINGMSETVFAPNDMLTRAQFITLLAKVDGVDLAEYEGKDAGFEDVKSSHWWNEVICWAVEKGYTSGISETKFGPNDTVTREQLARFFCVYFAKNGIDVSERADLSAFEDEAKISSWARESVEWAVAKGLIAGTSETALSPRGTATRAQAARMIMLFDELLSK